MVAESYTDILWDREKGGCRLETVSFPTIVTKAGRKRGGIFCVCLRDKDRKNSVNSSSVQNVCERTALTDSSSNMHQFHGATIILRHFSHIHFCVVAWEMEDRNKIIFFFHNFHLFSLNQSKMIKNVEK